MKNQVIVKLQRKLGVKPDGDFGSLTSKAFAAHFGLITVEAAHILGQCHHESAGFTSMEENLNYSAKRLLEIFPRYFDPGNVEQYAQNPVAIGNRVYADRMGNGPESSGDGWKHRGKGPLQLTGKDNQTAFLESVHLHPDATDQLIDELAFESAIWFFRRNKLLIHCRNVSQLAILTVSRAVNIGNPLSQLIPHGMDSRQYWTMYYFNLLAR